MPRHLAPAAGAGTRSRVHPLMVVTILSMLLPISFDIGTLYMTPMRTLYVFTVPYLLLCWVRGDCGGKLLTDWLIFAYIAWMGVTLIFHHPNQLATFTGSTGVTVIGGYLTARLTIRSAQDFFAFVRFFALVVVLIVLPLGLYESFTKNGPVAIDFFKNHTWFDTYDDMPYCCRLGLDRAQTVFIHPIHSGIFCAIGFALYYTALTNHEGPIKRGVMAGLMGLATFTSVSSGAVLPVAFMGAMILFTITLHNNPNQWRMFTYGASAMYFLLEVNSTKFAFFTISEKLAFNTKNVHLRQLLYETGVDQIKRTPIVGFGYKRLSGLPHWMTGSVDNFWLQQGVSHGVLGFLLPFSAFIYSMSWAGRNGFTKGSDLYYIRVAYGITLAALVLAMATVAVWAEVQSAIFLALGAGQFLFHATEPDADSTAATTLAGTAQRGTAAYTRFPAGTTPPAGTVRPTPTAGPARSQRPLRRDAPDTDAAASGGRASSRRP